MQNHSLPLLFFAFANDKTRPLHAIPKEFNELDNLLLTKKHLCEAQFKPNISAYDFHHVISALGKDIYIIHYGGHTDGYQTVFTDENQDASPFHGSGFVEMIKALPHLQLVFINGCNSAQMVNELYDAGVPAVIGTTHNVQDTVAYELSVAFYKGLANQNTITAAWTQATALIRGQYKTDNRFRDLYFEENDIETNSPHAAWFIKLREGAGDWRLIEIEEEAKIVTNNKVEITGNNNTTIQNANNNHINITNNYVSPSEKETSSFPSAHNATSFSLAHPTIGRENDLAAVREMLNAQQQCIVVNGIGGIGKTTLAKYYIAQYKSQYKHIIWLQEKDTAANILLDDSLFLARLGIDKEVLAFKNASNPNAALELTLSKLNELPKQTLLVADNVNDLHGFQTICNVLDKETFFISWLLLANKRAIFLFTN